MSKNARTLHAAAGEHLVLGELLRLDIEAYLAQGPTQSGWDILARQNGALKKVQVKTVSWPEKGAVNISPPTVLGGNDARCDTTQCFDVMVVVLLCKKEPRSRFLVLTPQDVRNRWTRPKKKRKDKKWTMTIPKELDEFAQYEDKWDRIRLPAQSSTNSPTVDLPLRKTTRRCG